LTNANLDECFLRTTVTYIVYIRGFIVKVLSNFDGNLLSFLSLIVIKKDITGILMYQKGSL